ncbi:MAG TPA: hypothetical protein VM736_10585 [Gemmatimonadales bacterium]|nr:hypothetical protein [Gemmatimonadales bacterium]
MSRTTQAPPSLIPRARPPSRILTTFTAGVVLLDALLLTYGGLALHRTMLVAWGGVFFVAAALIVVGWRRYRQRMQDLERERYELRAEVESIRDLLHSIHLHN